MPVIAEQRDVVQIFEFSSYDVRSDEFVKSRRWATNAPMNEPTTPIKSLVKSAWRRASAKSAT